jgi:transmembrane sensor
VSDPNPDMQKATRGAIEARAADFLQRRRFWSWTEQDQAELDFWLDQSSAHRIAFLRLKAGLDRMERLAALSLSKSAFAAPAASAWVSVLISIPVMATAAAAAALALAVVFGMPLLRELLRPADIAYATAVGGRALVSVADGTKIELNTDTALRTSLTNEQRTVWLDKGEAWFRVAHNAADPFTVIVGNHRVTDLGTEFLIRRDADRVEVAVLEGRAQLSMDGGRATSLTPGDDAVATTRELFVTKKTARELANKLAWQHDVLIFKDTPLSQAAYEFNRYNRTKLVITDPAVARLTIGGEFKTDNLDDFLNLAQAILRLRVTHEGNDIKISR